MQPPSKTQFVEYLSQHARSNGAFESRIAEQIPPNLILKERSTGTEVGPGLKGYSICLEKFASDVSDSKARTILTFLYQFDAYLKRDLGLFARMYQHLFDGTGQRERWTAVAYNFPKINQTTLAVILDVMSETIIGYRLEDLERIGLVERSRVKPPHPRHVCITHKGIGVIEAAIKDGIGFLTPVLKAMDEPQPAGVPSSGDAEKLSSFR